MGKIEPPKHMCNMPGCEVLVKQRFWGCPIHWRVIPKELRDALWKSYVVGQGLDVDYTAEYKRAAKNVQEWIKDNMQ